jgi:uncharacterized membrane protein (DUF485 family)
MLESRNNNTNKQKSPSKRFLSILGLFMFGFYFVLGLIIWKDFPLALDRTYRILFGILLIVYSFLRFARLWQNQRLERKR